MSSVQTYADEVARFATLQAATRSHRRHHGCNAYTFEDGAGLLALARAESAARILELGTAIGYTACILASATEQTQVDTIEGDPEHVALARNNIRDLGLDERVTVHSGDFFEVMADLNGPYDLAFFDGLGPTVRLIATLRNVLRPGGLLVCGNLAHAGTAERRSIAVEFEQSGRWQLAGSIEGGGTLAFRKINPGAPSPTGKSRKELFMTSDEEQIHALRTEWLEAAQSRDLDRIMETYYPGPDYLAYDVMPPFIFEGWETFRAHWKRFFEMFDRDPTFERADTKVHCSGDVAFTTGLTRFVGSIGGKAFDIWTRETLGYRKFEGNWRIIHDHVSVPIDLDTGIGITDFKP